MITSNLNRSRLITVTVTCILLAVFSLKLLSDPIQVQKLIADGKLQEALNLTNSELAKDSENLSYQFLKGLILTRQEKLEPARDVFLGITRKHPELPEPYNNLAVIYASMGDFDKARQALEQAINTHPAYATAHENLGDIYAKLASQAYNQALELDKENNTAKTKLSLVSELFSVPHAGSELPVQLAFTDEDRQQQLREKQETERKLAEQQQLREKQEADRKLAEQQQLREKQEADRKLAEQQRLREKQEADRKLAEQQQLREKQETEQRIAEQQQLREKQEADRKLAEQQQLREKQEADRKLAEQQQLREKQEAERKLAEQQQLELQDEQHIVSAVKQGVIDWSQAWSARDINKYLSWYASDFTPPDGRTSEQWRLLRQKRLGQSGAIKVTIADLVVEMTGPEHARATFTQNYQSEIYSDRVKKTLLLKLDNNKWLITEEQTN